MKIKALLATLVGAVALQGASAGTSWCPPDKGAKGGKCPIVDCPDIGASIGVGYDSDYIYKGVRVAEDWLWGDVNYTFDGLPLTPTIGVWHGTGLASFFGFDWTQIYADLALPSVAGFDVALGYRAHFFPNLRGPSPGRFFDSFSTISLTLSRELFAGISGYYMAEYFTGQAALSDWYHELGFAKSIELRDNIGLDLSAGVAYNDDLWGTLFATGSGFNHYYFRAGLPIALNCRATLTPYIGYNGTPDGWKADGVGLPIWNRNDAFHGGVSLRVNF